MEAATHLCANLTYPLLVVVAVLMPVVVLLRTSRPVYWLGVVDALLFTLGTGSVVVFYLLAAHRTGRPLAPSIVQLPLVFWVDIGISLQKARAVFEAVFGQRSAFIRTPKSGSDGSSAKRARPPRSWTRASRRRRRQPRRRLPRHEPS